MLRLPFWWLLATACTLLAPGAPGSPLPVRDKTAMCAGCHGIPGYRTAYPAVYPVPMIGGQKVRYLEAALHAYRSGERAHPGMQAIARSLSDQDIAGLAAFYGSGK